MKGYLVYEQWTKEPFNEICFYDVYLNKADAYKKVEKLINVNKEEGYSVYCRFEDIYMDDDADHNNDVYIWVQEVEIVKKHKKKYVNYCAVCKNYYDCDATGLYIECLNNDFKHFIKK